MRLEPRNQQIIRMMTKPPPGATARLVGRGNVAFSLTELLVVIAVIGLLSSLFLATLSRAKSAARSAVCKSNLRQQGLALAMYVNEFHKYPLSRDPRVPAVMVWSGRHYVTLGGWAQMLLPYIMSKSLDLNEPKTFLCPELDRILPVEIVTGNSESWTVAARPIYMSGFYGYNGYGTAINIPDLRLGLGREWNSDGDQSVSALPESAVRNPSEMIAISDSSNGFSLISPIKARVPSLGLIGYVPSERHRSGANMVLTDGHTEYSTQKYLVAPKNQVRKRWNNDNEPHPETW